MLRHLMRKSGWSACIWAVALLFLTPSLQAADDFLAPEQAFIVSATMRDANTIALSYAIADGYYMYRERFSFGADGAVLGVPVMAPGKIKFDATFGKNVETYRGALTILLPVTAQGAFTLKATGQGCADQGLCYPPMTVALPLSALLVSGQDASLAPKLPAAPLARSAIDGIEATLQGGRLLAILPLFLLLGVGLAFTPCVLPMVPILSFIIVGEGAGVRRARALLLTFMYVLGMALVYTGLGVAAGLAGEGLAATLQHPWVLGSFAALMALLSLSMFDLFQLQMPAAIQLRLTQASSHQARGKLAGEFAMGALSALIVGPCVAAPLAGALVYISQTRDVVIGGSALFALAMGMSVPLLLVGASAGTLLPRAGVWMNAVKHFFGVLMLAMALWMVAPLIPMWSQMLGWALLATGYGGSLLRSAGTASHFSAWFSRAFGLVLALLGLLQLIGAVSGGSDPLAPLTGLTGSQAVHTRFERIKTVAELDAVLAQAGPKGVLLDFYADWCVSCKEMEKFTLSDPRVRDHLADLRLLQVDVTANDASDKAMLKRFNLFGPPGILFFDGAGREIAGSRVIGYQNAERFLQVLGSLQQ